MGEPHPLPQRTLAADRYLALDLGDGATLDTVLIPAGVFMMGSPESEDEREPQEGPQRQVTITRPFHMGVTEVTRAQWWAVMSKPQSGRDNPLLPNDVNRPISGVSWNDAVAFCNAASDRTGHAVRLPTEAEWEYACRAGTTTRFYYGDDPGRRLMEGHDSQDVDIYLCRHLYATWLDTEVSVMRPSTWGLYNMHSHAWEWCHDWHAESYAGAETRDPQGPPSGAVRILRGGHQSRAAVRRCGYPDLPGYGFRVVVSTDATGAADQAEKREQTPAER